MSGVFKIEIVEAEKTLSKLLAQQKSAKIIAVGDKVIALSSQVSVK